MMMVATLALPPTDEDCLHPEMLLSKLLVGVRILFCSRHIGKCMKPENFQNFWKEIKSVKLWLHFAKIKLLRKLSTKIAEIFWCLAAFFRSDDQIFSVPPRLQNPGYSQQTLQVDQRFSLFCSIVDGDEPIVLSWRKDGELLIESETELLGMSISRVEHDSILRFSSLEAHHMGNYSCHARNAAGHAVKYSYLQVKGTWVIWLHCTTPAPLYWYWLHIIIEHICM